MHAVRKTLTAALLASSALAGIAHAQTVPTTALPTGGRVAAGQVTIAQPNGGAMTITQGSDKAIVNWQGFSIGRDARVDIVQPNASSALLNRVTGSATSTIAGQINANGQVFLINPNGIVITKSGSVSAAGFAASTLDIADADFLAGNYRFAGTGNSAEVANHGQIRTVGRGGYAALIGGRVSNSGLIAAPLGRIGLGAGETATLDFAGDGFLQVAVPGAAKGGALIDQSGRLSADGGLVVLTAAAAREAARVAVNLTGVVEARSLAEHDGTIILSGGDGAVALAGTLDASALGGSAAAGGRVTVTGGDIALTGATIDASGESGGGAVRIGGDWQGGGTLARAQTLTVDSASAIRADAQRSGDGGSVVLWSDERTGFAGTISARGIGAGGDAEVSGKALLDYSGSADLRGGTAFGNLLLDPYNVTISAAADSGHTGFTAGADDSVINAATLIAALGKANVTVSTGSGGSQAGDITLSADLTWNTSATLTLQAARNIMLTNAITARAGGLVLNAGAAINTGAGGAVEVARFTLAGGNWNQIGASLPYFAAGDFAISGGTFLRALGGDGTSATPYLLSDIYGVQGMEGWLSAHYALANDVDASGTALWDGGKGFKPIGYFTPFSGSFDGKGHAVVGLTISRTNFVGLFSNLVGGSVSRLGLEKVSITGSSLVGALAGAASSATLTQLWTTGTITGDRYVGGIAGQLVGGSLTQAWTTADVSALSTALSNKVGGLVGEADTVFIDESWASGRVSASFAGVAFSGGLVGVGYVTTVTDSYWDTQTTGQSASGGGGGTGLTTAQMRSGGYGGFDFTNVWYQAGDMRPILRSMATAPDGDGKIAISNIYQLQLMGANPAGNYVLTRDIDASVTASTADSAGIWGAGGFVPVNNSSAGRFDGRGHVISGLTINRTGAPNIGLFGQVSGTVANVGLAGVSVAGGSGVGALAGAVTGGTISRSWASGAVRGSISVGGLAGRLQFSTVTESWATAGVTGTATMTGGLVGEVVGGGTTIAKSWSSGPVIGSHISGGLVGSLDQGRVEQSWATGSVSGNDTSGGLVGTVDSGSIHQSWASGAVSSAGDAGGLIGEAGSGSVTESYWDIGTTGQTTSAGGTGLTTAQARQGTSYAGWDRASVWYQAGDMRPILRSTAAAPDADGKIAISNLYQLQLVGANLAGNYLLTRDIDAAAANGATPAGVWGSGGFVPIGMGSAPFAGRFDGQDHVISNLTINRDQSEVGLFNQANGEIANLGLANVSITGLTQVGALAGRSYGGGAMSRVWATGTVSGIDQVGGLVGEQYGNITQSWSGVTLHGEFTVGGLVGTQRGNIHQSWAMGAVSGLDSIGGIAGRSITGSTSGSFWNTTTTGRQYAFGGSLNGSAVGLTTAEFQDSTGFVARARAAGWDFDTVWAPPAAGQYPQLQGQTRTVMADAGSTSRVYGDTGGGSAGLVRYYGLGRGEFITTGSTVSGTGASASAGVGTYGLTVTGGAASNPDYRFVGVGSVTVTPRPLTITPDAVSRTYGEANPTAGTGAGDDLVNGDTITGVTLGSTATAASDVGEYNLTASAATGTGLANYTISYAARADGLTVTPRALTITPDAVSRAYGAANPDSGTATGDNLVNGDTITAVTLGSTAATASGVGSYGLTGSAATGTGLSNYTISYAPRAGGLTITPATLVYAADALSRYYGDANTGLSGTVTGFVNGDTLASATSGALAWTGAANSTSGVGSYAITGSGLTAANYVFVQAAGNAAALTVTARPITVTADALSRAYGDANPALSYTVGGAGLVNGDSLSGALATAAGLGSNAGSYAIGQGTLAASSNYALSYVGADLVVTPRALTITPDALSRIYGDANPALTYTIGGAGLVNGDTLTGALATAAGLGSNVGSYAIGQGTLAASSNYALSYVGADLAVTARPIIVTADALSRIYGDANPALTYTIGGAGLVNGDTLTGALATAAGLGSAVGSYAIGQGTLAASANYALNYVGANLAVTPRALTITPDAVSRAYGDANPTRGTATAAGLINGDAVAGVSLASAATAASGVGGYALDASAAVGTGLSNYAITYATRAGGLTVTPRAITATADALSRIYGDANPALTYTVGGAGLVNGDTLTGALATAAGLGSNVGSYAIGQGTLAASANYALNYVGADLAVTPRALTITPDAVSRAYGDANPTRGTATAAGLVNGDAVAGVSLASTATGASGVGGYALDASAAVGTGLSNYAITYATRAGGLTVTPRAIIVTADGVSRIYGDANPALTYTVGGAGLVNGDGLSGALATQADARSGIGSYGVTQGSLAASANYVLSFTPGALSITPRPIRIAAAPASRPHGQPNPPLVASIGGAGLAAFHADLAAAGYALETAAAIDSPVGGYPILLAGTNANYAVTYDPGVLTVVGALGSDHDRASVVFPGSPAQAGGGSQAAPVYAPPATDASLSTDEIYLTADARLEGAGTCIGNRRCDD